MSSDVICPHCGYDFYEDKPEISWETEKYMLDNNYPVPQTHYYLFEEATADWMSAPSKLTLTCFKCDKKFIAHKHESYSVTKIEEPKNDEDS
jgi:hypothetical protein